MARTRHAKRKAKGQPADSRVNGAKRVVFRRHLQRTARRRSQTCEHSPRGAKGSKGLSATCIEHKTLKKEDLPTLGSPTSPALRFVPGRPSVNLGAWAGPLLGAAAPCE